MVAIINKGALAKTRPQIQFKPGVQLDKEIRILGGRQGSTLVEIAAADFDKAFVTRQRYEIDAGRDEEPLLYQPLYSQINDPNLPQVIPVNRLGPAGVIWEEINEQGEVKFAQLSESADTVKIVQYAAGVEYTENMVRYNQTWNFPLVERRVGISFNALLNHLHFSPIINATYGSSNLTGAATGGANRMENILRTLENAIIHGVDDNVNRRNGPYIILCSTADQFLLERLLTNVGQLGYQAQSTAIGLISAVIAYNGWSGVRGKKAVTYPGCTTNTFFLISLNNQQEDFQSWTKIDFERSQGNADVSRFILEQVVFQTHRGVFSNPIRAVEKVTIPAS